MNPRRILSLAAALRLVFSFHFVGNVIFKLTMLIKT